MAYGLPIEHAAVEAPRIHHLPEAFTRLVLDHDVAARDLLVKNR